MMKQHTMASNMKELMTMTMNATTIEDDKKIQQKEQHQMLTMMITNQTIYYVDRKINDIHQRQVMQNHWTMTMMTDEEASKWLI